MSSDGKFLRMVNYGPVYRPVLAAVDAALKSGTTHRQAAEELAFIIATVSTAGDLDLDVTIKVIEQVKRVQASAMYYKGESVGDA
jgi:hypothetical protein